MARRTKAKKVGRAKTGNGPDRFGAAKHLETLLEPPERGSITMPENSATLFDKYLYKKW